MELVWEDLPVPDAPFFTKDAYDKHSLAPTVRELWECLQSRAENANTKNKSGAGAAKALESNNSSCHSREDSQWNSCDSDNTCADTTVDGGEEEEEPKKANKCTTKQQGETEVDAAYPEPRLPYPCLSCLSNKEHKTYLDILQSKKPRLPPQNLQARVNREVMHFMQYLQDVANQCADDYNFITEAALQYSEEFFKDCLEHISTIPQFYQIHEMTSLTGGTFNPGIKLIFEKQLLIMGNVDITDHKILPADALLASDYQSVSSLTPPAKKAKDVHATISSDANAEKLSVRYEPHVCLTGDALIRLLNNNGPDFAEQWELPVCVKLSPGVGSGQKKTVYVDSPLLKTEVTVRERSHIYHQESLKLSFKRNGSRGVFHVMTELPANEHKSSESSQRNVVSFDDHALDFEVDLTDLETFGESASVKTPKVQKGSALKSAEVTGRSSGVSKRSDEHLDDTSRSSQEELEPSSAAPPAASDQPDAKQRRLDSDTASDEVPECGGDSDDEKLVIDDSVSPPVNRPSAPTAESPRTPVSESSPSPRTATRPCRRSRGTQAAGDQLSEILRMQSAMFSSAHETPKCPLVSNAASPSAAPAARSHPTSLVKPCVSSYLERNKGEETSGVSSGSAPAANTAATEGKKILSQDLQAGAEDEKDYDAPEEGNLLYKLYSLQDLLLMVRSSVSLTHTRKVGSQNQYVPVHVLPKLEYQLNYGAECLSSREACQLWTEAALHSSTVSYTAHINAFTSEVALLRKLPDGWEQKLTCGFKPSKSLNILHHLLKKLTRLEPGRYLIAHKVGEPFVTLLKEANGKVTRGAYDLQKVHSCAPTPPASGLVPWIPVDPAVVLPFHHKHGQIPCSFPIKPMLEKTISSQANGKASAQQQRNNSNAGRNAKRKTNKRAAKRKKYVEKLIQKSV